MAPRRAVVLPLGLSIVLASAAGPTFGQATLEEALDGFDDESPPAAVTVEEAIEGFEEEPAPARTVPAAPRDRSSGLRLGGKVGERVVVSFAHRAPPPGGVDHRGLSSLRSRIDLEAEADLGPGWRMRLTGHAWFDTAFRIKGRSGYPTGFLETYERETELGELLVQGPLNDRIDLTLGRQVVAWGRSDNIRVVDVLNPVDRRLPGMTDIADLRLPVAMARLDLHAAPWSVSAIAIPERRFDELPVPGSDFFPGTGSLPPRDHPGDGLRSPEAALAVTGTFPGRDFSLYAARIHDPRPHVVATDSGARRRHGRLWMVGAAGNEVFGSWLLKAEIAAFTGRRYTGSPGRTFSSLNTLAGVEYSGLPGTTVSLDASNHHILGFVRGLEALPDDRRRNEPSSALRISRRYRNDTIELSLVAIAFGLAGENGMMQRLEAVHHLTDAIELGAGLVLYQGGEQAPFRGIGRNDRFFLSLDYHF